MVGGGNLAGHVAAARQNEKDTPHRAHKHKHQKQRKHSNRHTPIASRASAVRTGLERPSHVLHGAVGLDAVTD